MGIACGVAISGNYAYVADGYAGLQIIDISNPAACQWAGGVFFDPGYAAAVAVSSNYAYVANSYGGLQIVDVTEPTNPQVIGAWQTSGSALGVGVSGHYVYLADNGAGLQVLDVTNPANPQRVGGNGAISAAGAVAVSGSKVAVAGNEQGLVLFNAFTSGPTITFNSSARLDQNSFRLTFQGLPGLPIEIQRSTNLITWESCTNLTLTTAPIQSEDPVGTPQVFYRAVAR
jgi:hypothetical protein